MYLWFSMYIGIMYVCVCVCVYDCIVMCTLSIYCCGSLIIVVGSVLTHHGNQDILNIKSLTSRCSAK